MKWPFTFAIVGAVAFGVSAAPPETNGADDYNVILQRNAFQLQPAARPPAPPATEPAQAAPEIRLTGIAAFEGRHWAFFAARSDDQTWRYFKLSDGESDGALQVRTVNAGAGVVEVRHDGNLERWTLKTETLPATQPSPAELAAPPPVNDDEAARWRALMQRHRRLLQPDAPPPVEALPPAGEFPVPPDAVPDQPLPPDQFLPEGQLPAAP